MTGNRILIAVALAIVGTWASAARAQLLYEETFEPAGSAIEDSGWTVDYHPNNGSGNGFAGTYSGTFDPNFDVLRDAANNQPINGNTGVFIGVGGPVAGGLGAFSVTEGLGGFENIDPALCERLILSVYANLQFNNGAAENDLGYFAVRMGDGDSRTDDDAWFIASSPMAEPTSTAEFFDLRTLEFDPSPGNWNELALGPVVIGGPAGDLAGLLITGVGIVMSVTNPDPLPNFDVPDSYGSWNFADYRITCVPEPTALVLLTFAMPIWLVCRRRSR
jgi:hypothetical protein